ncbi:MAG TPA: NifB/NifX family molybdenum-iron cluster-binding protein [Phycisphaerae bacterium]|nr:NifB/NifX family molybdenum-iron cluster-binding protein [Phycisphaerae bacterium]HUW30660.1 NifB/NifX family molybdenum-iron cluster-binding protein [Planctomycetota bacterium]
MKVCITSSGPSLDSQVDPRFGRAAYFLIFDIDARTYDVIENKQQLDAAQGAGVQAAATVAKSGAEAVLTGNCGPKAFRVLEESKIPVYVGLDKKTVVEAIGEFTSGKLQPITAANVEGHW